MGAIKPVVFLVCLTVFAGCQQKRTFTLNPDGSGKLLLETQGDSESATGYGRLRWIRDILGRFEGVDAWCDAAVEEKDGKPLFRATALFPDINKFGTADPSPRPTWSRKENNIAVLEITNPGNRPPVSRPAQLTEEQIAAQIQTLREQKTFGGPIDDNTFRQLRLEYVFHLPGSLAEQTNFSVGKDDSLSLLTFERLM